MAYTALYRTFRPTLFSDMVGQDHITKTLKNQIMAGRVGHAYLFSGGRGTGKTTSAKILARTVNCLNPQNGEPCNECEICKEILDGSLTDVVEMDAASNNGVEDIRAIRDAVNFLPTKAKFRVYIIDEVHMLSPGAFNALLKTLEEPPEHVKFILATTEPQKLPATILSRCQRFDFKKISDENIIKRLRIICQDSNIKISDEAYKIIAILSEGAMRDAISILERCSQESTDEISAQTVKDLVGIPALTYISSLTNALFTNNEMDALSAIDAVIKDGKDLYNFLWEVIKYVKDVLVYKATGSLEIYSSEEIEEISKLSELADKSRILSIIYDLSELENSIRWSSQKTIMFQAGILKICSNMQNSSYGNVAELENRISKLEEQLADMKSSEMMRTSENSYVKNPVIVQNKIEHKETEQDKKQTESPVGSNETWKKVIDVLRRNKKMMLYTTLINSRISNMNDLVIEIEFPNGLTSFNEKVISEPTNKTDLEKAILAVTGKQLHVKFKDGKVQKPEPKQTTISDIENLGIDVKIID